MKAKGVVRPVVLASASSRRVGLLQGLGVSFTQCAPHIDESIFSDEAPEAYVYRMAQTKAEAAKKIRAEQGRHSVYIAADTTVCFDGQCLGKPADRADFIRMMTLLSGQVHQVLSAVSFLSDEKQCTRISISDVTFDTLLPKQMQAYWRTGEPMDKAGGYAIQGLGSAFIKRLEGCYTSVMGLPVFETSQLLTQFGIPWALNP